ncbi:MAG: hypothetical protein JO362_19430 [Streptomycetaceae bacterium]|nr:hypothetical protein [Streptomycetaceae bacterium]
MTTALAVFPGDATPADVAAVQAKLTAIGAHPFERWDRARNARVQELAGWLHCAAMWRGQDLNETPDIPARPGHSVVHALIEAHATMPARHQAELAPFKDADGSLLGEDYDDHDEVTDRHTDEELQMLAVVMAMLAGEFGRPTPDTAPVPDAQAGMAAVLSAMTDPDLEGGDIVEELKGRLSTLGFDLTIPEPDDETA